VQQMLQINGGTHWRSREKRCSTIVFIGANLDADFILNELKKCER